MKNVQWVCFGDGKFFVLNFFKFMHPFFYGVPGNPGDMENPIRIRILDNEYLLRSDEDPEQVNEIAKLINDKLDEVRKNSHKLSEGKTAILVAFDIAGDYLRLLKERDILLRDVQDRCRLMNRQIESLE